MEEHTISVPFSAFERLMTSCCNQHGCLDDPKSCKCAAECGLSLVDLIEERDND